MAEDKHIEGEQLRERLEKLVGQWSKGQVTLKQIVGLSDEELYAIASQGYLLFLQGKTESARVMFEGLVACDPKNAYYYRALGAIYWRLKEPQKAIKQFTYAIRVAPRDVSSYVNRAEVYVSLTQWQLAKDDLAAARRFAEAGDAALVKKANAILQRIP
jgi:tetratricopeptide (TPR) repeat protein